MFDAVRRFFLSWLTTQEPDALDDVAPSSVTSPQEEQGVEPITMEIDTCGGELASSPGASCVTEYEGWIPERFKEEHEHLRGAPPHTIFGELRAALADHDALKVLWVAHLCEGGLNEEQSHYVRGIMGEEVMASVVRLSVNVLKELVLYQNASDVWPKKAKVRVTIYALSEVAKVWSKGLWRQRALEVLGEYELISVDAQSLRCFTAPLVWVAQLTPSRANSHDFFPESLRCDFPLNDEGSVTPLASFGEQDRRHQVLYVTPKHLVEHMPHFVEYGEHRFKVVADVAGEDAHYHSGPLMTYPPGPTTMAILHDTHQGEDMWWIAFASGY